MDRGDWWLPIAQNLAILKLAGLLVITVGVGWCFTLDALSYVAVLIALALMRPAELYRHSPKPRGRGEVRAGMRYISRMTPFPEGWVVREGCSVHATPS